MVHRSDDAFAAQWTSSSGCRRLLDRCRLSLTSAAGSGRRRRVAALVAGVYDRKRKASMSGVTSRGRLRPEAEGVDGWRHLSLASTAENRGRRRSVLPGGDSRGPTVLTNGAPSHWWLQPRTEASTDGATSHWRLQPRTAGVDRSRHLPL